MPISIERAKISKYLSILLSVCLLCIFLAKPVYAGCNFMYGDVNSSGEVDVADAILVLRHIVGLDTLEGDCYYAADVNDSRTVDVADAILILRWIVGLTDFFPGETYLEEARIAVERAESSGQQTDIDAAQDLVDTLPPITPRDLLQVRLNGLRDALDRDAAIAAAINAISVLPAPGNLTLEDRGAVEKARLLVNSAVDEHGATVEEIFNLSELLEAEETITTLEIATTAVEMAHTIRDQATVDYARSLVDQLPPGGARDTLENHLVAIEVSLPVAIAVDLEEAGDKEAGVEFNLILTIVNKFGDTIVYDESPCTTVITSDLDGELFSGGICFDGDNGEAMVPISLQTLGLHLLTAEAVGVGGILQVNVPPIYSTYAVTIDGPDELGVGRNGYLSLRTRAEGPHGNSSITAAYEFEVTGGEYGLFKDVGILGLIDWYKLPPDHDSTTTLVFIPYEAASYEIKVILRSQDNENLAEASYMVKAGIEISEVAGLADITVDYDLPLAELPLPEQVEVVLEDNSVQEVDVIWDEGTPAFDGTLPGAYIFTGTLFPGEGVINPAHRKAHVKVIVLEPIGYTCKLILAGPGLASDPPAGDIEAGTEVTIAITPPEGKLIDTFTVNEEDRKGELVDNHFTFVITANTVVAVTFRDPVPRSYNLQLTVNEGDSATVVVGEEITLKVVLERTDEDREGSYIMFSMQDEIEFDSRYFSLVEGSESVAPGYDFNVRSMDDGFHKRIIISRAPGNAVTPDSLLLATFRLEALQIAQDVTIASKDYKVNQKDGEAYATAANDISVTIAGSIRTDPHIMTPLRQ